MNIRETIKRKSFQNVFCNNNTKFRWGKYKSGSWDPTGILERYRNVTGSLFETLHVQVHLVCGSYRFWKLFHIFTPRHSAASVSLLWSFSILVVKVMWPGQPIATQQEEWKLLSEMKVSQNSSALSHSAVRVHGSSDLHFYDLPGFY